MKAKYLGIYLTDVNFFQTEDFEEDTEYRYSHKDDETDYYPQDLFMRTESDSQFDGIASETNSSAIALKILDDESVKLWRIW